MRTNKAITKNRYNLNIKIEKRERIFLNKIWGSYKNILAFNNIFLLKLN